MTLCIGVHRHHEWDLVLRTLSRGVQALTAPIRVRGIDQPNLWQGESLRGWATYGALVEQAPKAFGVILTSLLFGRKEGKEAKKNFDFEPGTTQLLFVPDILGELALCGTCAIVLDEGLLLRSNEGAFVETKRKLVDECELSAVVSLSSRVLSTAGIRVKIIQPFFTKGRMTERIWF